MVELSELGASVVGASVDGASVLAAGTSVVEPVLGASVVADELVLPATGLEHGVVVTTMNFLPFGGSFLMILMHFSSLKL